MASIVFFSYGIIIVGNPKVLSKVSSCHRHYTYRLFWVVSVVDFRVVVLRQPGRFSCRFPSPCFAATGSFQFSISESLFCGNRVISVVDFQVVLRQPLHRSFQLSISESLFCGNRDISVVDFRVVLRQPGRFSCRFPSRCFAATGSFQLSISESLFCGNRVVSVVDFRVVVLRQPGRFSCRFPSRCFAATGSFQLSISESLFWGNRVVSVVDFRVVVLRQLLQGW